MRHLLLENFHLKAKLVKPGETKADDLEKIIGSSPNAVLPLKEGKIHLYNFGDAKTNGLQLILVNFSKTNAGLDSALFFVNDEGTVTDKIISSNSEKLDWEFWPFGDE